MASACTPRIRPAQQRAVAAREKGAAEQAAAQDLARRLADAERASLENPDRPAVLHPGTWPDKITVRIVQGKLIIAEISPDPADSTSWDAEAETAEDLWDPANVMAGAEVALAALGYTLDRFRMYMDMDLLVGHFYRKAGPYA